MMPKNCSGIFGSMAINNETDYSSIKLQRTHRAVT